MQAEELDAIADTIVETVKTHTTPLADRLDALAKREPAIGPAGPAGKDGRDGLDAPAIDIHEVVKQAAALVPPPKDGQPGRDGLPGPAGVAGRDGHDAPPVDLVEVAKQAAALIPAPRDGRDGADADIELIVSKVMARVSEQIAAFVALEVTKAVAAIEKPKDGRDGVNGRSVTLEDLAPLVSVEVTKAVIAMERPKDGTPGRDGVDGKDGKDGQSVTLDQVAPVIISEVTKAVDAIPRPKDGEPGRDGVGVAGALLDNAGQLVVTLSNGTLQPLGVVVGSKGEPGKDGRDGKDGSDGVGFDDLSVEQESDRTMAFVFRQGERVKSFPVTFPVQIHRGVFDVTKTYERGDCSTWSGSTWQAIRQTSGLKPGDGPSEKTGWLLVTKAGRDGRSGKDGEAGKPGRDGKDGGPKW